MPKPEQPAVQEELGLNDDGAMEKRMSPAEREASKIRNTRLKELGKDGSLEWRLGDSGLEEIISGTMHSRRLEIRKRRPEYYVVPLGATVAERPNRVTFLGVLGEQALSETEAARIWKTLSGATDERAEESEQHAREGLQLHDELQKMIDEIIGKQKAG